jgi:1-acyl-sn-glycerol-3-phosphate acyltransferase
MSPFEMEVIAAAAVTVFGITLIFRRQPTDLPLSIELLRKCAVVYLAVFKRFRVVDAQNIPLTGPLVLVANHTAVYDPVCLQVACKHRLIRFMEAREYYNVKGLRFLYAMVRVIPVNRNGNDTAAIRTAVRELCNNGCIGIFPEGRISTDGQIHRARQGVALIALMSNASVVPAFFQGTLPFSGMVRDFFQFNQVTLHFGPPIRFDDLAGKHRDEAVRNIALKRIMDAIGTLEEKARAPIAGLK